MTTLLAPLWLSDPAWLSMDATARGMHTQLLLLAARRKPAGTLPDDDQQWRKWLGIPLRRGALKEAQIPKAWGKSFSELGLPDILVGAIWQIQEQQQDPDALDPEALTIWLWINRWKPMILSAWERIEQTHADDNPRLSGLVGGWFNPLALALAQGSSELLGPQTVATIKKSTRKKQAGPPPSWEDQVGHNGDVANRGLDQVSVEHAPLRDPVAVLARWRPEVDEISKKSMWDIGITCLVGGSASDTEKGKARGILGKHIKQYGEEAVAKAVGALAMRSVAPADAVSFLQGLLRQAEEGSPSQQAARQKRATLCL